MRLGQEVDLLDALPEALAGDAARADADHRLHGLEPGALGVLPRVEEAEQALAAVRLDPDREQAERQRERRREGEEAERARPRRAGSRDHQESAIVVPRSGSSRISAANAQTTRPTGFISSPSVRGAGRRARTAQTQTQTASFASSDGWKLAGPRRNQRCAPLIGGADDEHGDAGDERADEQHRRERPQTRGSRPRERGEQDEARDRVEALLDEEAHRVALADRGRGRRGAEDHHEPERDEPERDEDQEALLELSSVRASAAGHPESFCTRRRNSSPRCSKLVNWSKLAQAGERRTTSPADAAAPRAATARVERPATSYGTPCAVERRRELVGRLADQVGAVARLERARERVVGLGLAAPAEDHVLPASGERASARSAAATFVAFESLT